MFGIGRLRCVTAIQKHPAPRTALALTAASPVARRPEAGTKPCPTDHEPPEGTLESRRGLLGERQPGAQHECIKTGTLRPNCLQNPSHRKSKNSSHPPTHTFHTTYTHSTKTSQFVFAPSPVNFLAYGGRPAHPNERFNISCPLQKDRKSVV